MAHSNNYLMHSRAKSIVNNYKIQKILQSNHLVGIQQPCIVRLNYRIPTLRNIWQENLEVGHFEKIYLGFKQHSWPLFPMREHRFCTSLHIWSYLISMFTVWGSEIEPFYIKKGSISVPPTVLTNIQHISGCYMERNLNHCKCQAKWLHFIIR